jgi:N-acetylneuraminate synthase
MAFKILNENIIWLRRPGGGDFSVADYELLFGKKALVKISRGTQIKREDIN